jgi:hypothetical protein
MTLNFEKYFRYVQIYLEVEGAGYLQLIEIERRGSLRLFVLAC